MESIVASPGTYFQNPLVALQGEHLAQPGSRDEGTG